MAILPARTLPIFPHPPQNLDWTTVQKCNWKHTLFCQSSLKEHAGIAWEGLSTLTTHASFSLLVLWWDYFGFPQRSSEWKAVTIHIQRNPKLMNLSDITSKLPNSMPFVQWSLTISKSKPKFIIKADIAYLLQFTKKYIATNVSCFFQSFVAIQNTRTLHGKAPVLSMLLYS